MEFVKIRDESILKKQYLSIEEFENKAFEHKYRAFNLIYGNTKTGEFKYREHCHSGASMI